MARLGEVGVVWLSDASALDVVDLWNAELPGQPMQVAWRNGDWPSIAFDAMPSFLFFREGRVVESDVGGWGEGPTQ